MAKSNTMMVYVELVDGNMKEISPISGKELIKKVWTDDFAMPPKHLVFDAGTKDGKRVRIVVPFSDSEKSVAVIG